MKTVAFYISNHGFGHASRNIPLIKGMLEMNKIINVIIKTGKAQLDFMKQSLKAFSKIAYYEADLDVGLILKKGSLEIDKIALEKELLSFIRSWDIKIDIEAEFLAEKEVDLVISDIVPWIFKSCKKANVKSIFISNFTWVEIYKEYFNKNICEEYLECYKMADNAFLYSLFNNDLELYFKKYEEVGLACREFNELKVQAIKSKFNRPMVFVSVGRSVDLEQEIDVSNLPYKFICTEGIKLTGNNVTYLPIDTENTHDFVKACDYVITKAGWGTVAEALCAKKPMAILCREIIAEDRVTTEKVKVLKVGIDISFNELNSKSLINIINMLEDLKFNYDCIDEKYRNCSLDICNKISQYLCEE